MFRLSEPPLRIIFGWTVIGRGIILPGIICGYKAIGLWLLTPAPIGYRVIGNCTVAATVGSMPAGCREIIT